MTATPIRPAPALTANPRPVSRRKISVAPRGALVLVMAFGATACLLGFVLSGTGAVPRLTGLGLVLGAIVASLRVSRENAWVSVWAAPPAMALIAATLGQITLLGSAPTIAREVAMMLTALTATAPAQLLAVVTAATITYLRKRSARSSRNSLGSANVRVS